ncbi:MAG: thioredoxin-dependent thiol peroxidase [Crocinitomicaceae bacterium]|nr:thioredoxin-dependent thiol peroxidase [Crocinitomicaceae bacterium]MDG1736180.1 thioredoxin-dependent thiol peroxidase [Crocinitomicaceae bacterium]MDG2505768.1 thioredoxin-dependent thiol peroxidase [Crocinitomicaceae bacterium]
METLRIGDTVPSFEGVDQNNTKVTTADFKGLKWVVYFYPKDNTPGCTAQACSLRDGYDALLSHGIKVLGVSADSVKSHDKFSSKFTLPFSLLADENKEVINLFGVWGPKKFMGREYEGIHRISFVIDEKGFVSHIIQKPKTKDHANEILNLLELN